MPFRKPGRIVSWIVVVVFGIPGVYDLVTGSLAGSPGLALYGLGWTMIAAVFVLYALDLAALQTRRARVVRLVVGYLGLALAICGFVLKYRGIA
jgi:hypothetical protein